MGGIRVRLDNWAKYGTDLEAQEEFQQMLDSLIPAGAGAGAAQEGFFGHVVRFKQDTLHEMIAGSGATVLLELRETLPGSGDKALPPAIMTRTRIGVEVDVLLPRGILAASCWYCRCLGHRRPACPTAPKCARCGSRAHPPAKCPDRKRAPAKEAQAPQRGTAGGTDATPPLQATQAAAAATAAAPAAVATSIG